MPPPTRMNSAARLPPKPKPTSTFMASLLKIEKDDRRAEKPQPDRHHARHRAAFEGRFQCAFIGRQRLIRRPLVAVDGHAHADIAGRCKKA